MLPAILLGRWKGSVAFYGGSACWTFNPDATCVHYCDSPSPCTYGVSGGDKLPTAAAPWLIQFRYECCTGPAAEGGAYSSTYEIAGIDEKTMTVVERTPEGPVHYNAMTRQP